ncbi:MAG TPA: 23S rRNA (uracil(1939)-C(5))-methyltransferase RlmD, partial [Candidatus Desulfofervidus auxilii]|nr:23S rRNA (uracil(1939)-C(5))-methyltransferase RlmD [Candidatus Desulfofervidus auxilii]
MKKVKIEKLIAGGWGLARSDGKVIFVPYVLPEEIVRIKIFEEKKDYSLAHLIEVIDPSAQRILPSCPHFGICGGCDYQHMPYELQLKVKKDLLKETIIHQVGEINIKEVIPSTPFFYRNRIYLRIRREGYKVKLGFYKKNTHELISIERCPLAVNAINEMLPSLKEIINTHAAIIDDIKMIEIFYSPDEERGMTILHTLIKVKEKYLKKLAENLLERFSFLKDILIKHVGFVYPRSLFGKGYTQSGIFFHIDGLKLICYPGVFFQVNTEQNKKMISLIKKIINKSESILQLYAGIGNISLPLAKKVKSLIGLENNRLAVRNANYNAQLNKIKAFFKNIDVDKELNAFLKKSINFDCLVLDPPRQG